MSPLNADHVANVLNCEVGKLGKYIVKKECIRNNIDMNNIKPSDLLILADAIGNVMRAFVGEKKAERVRERILALKDLAENSGDTEVTTTLF